jgi:hypothetical protein
MLRVPGRRLFAAFIACLIALPGTSGLALGQQVATQWQGQYFYPSGDKRSPVPFAMSLQVSGGALSGRTAEPATFGNGSSSQLFANLRGNVSGNRIAFTKTYDGTGGVSHSVQYQGTISPDGRSMSGNWSIGDFGGTFSATATSPVANSRCLEPSRTLRNSDGFLYWNFVNHCQKEVFVSVCANYGNGVNPILGATVPPGGSADINLGASSLGQAKLSYSETGPVRCP